jgi:uncharacterized membrane protein YphA (DoxX/SURF4 family)
LSKARIIISWVLAVLVALAFMASAVAKLTGVATPMFAHWGYHVWFATLIGVLELTGAVGLLIPRITRYAILGLTVIMFGAAYTHLANHEGIEVLRPVVFLAVLWAIWGLRRTADG